MKLVAAIKLLPNAGQAAALEETLRRRNAACTWLAAAGARAGVARQYDLHRLGYREVRERFELSAQATVRCIAKTADAFKAGRGGGRRFRPLAAQPYDDRILRVAGEEVSLWTVAGRIRIPFVAGDHQRRLLPFRKGEADLTTVRGKWYLVCTCDVPDSDTAEISDWLGVDLGIVNLAADSDGAVHSGSPVERVRRTYAHRRRNLQRKRTRAAPRKLNRLRGREKRFRRHVNHGISKSIVRTANATSRGIALEELGGIRGRVKARRRQRARLHGWGFAQLRAFVAYKAALAGVPVTYVDPRDTSRQCPACGHVDKANRPRRDDFECVACGFAGPADTVAAANIRSRARAAVNRPEGACSRVDDAHVAHAA